MYEFNFLHSKVKIGINIIYRRTSASNCDLLSSFWIGPSNKILSYSISDQFSSPKKIFLTSDFRFRMRKVVFAFICTYLLLQLSSGQGIAFFWIFPTITLLVCNSIVYVDGVAGSDSANGAKLTPVKSLATGMISF